MSYWVVTGRLGVNLPLNISFMKIMIAGEAGYAWNAPSAAQLNLPSDGKRKGGASPALTGPRAGWYIEVNP